MVGLLNVSTRVAHQLRCRRYRNSVRETFSLGGRKAQAFVSLFGFTCQHSRDKCPALKHGINKGLNQVPWLAIAKPTRLLRCPRGVSVPGQFFEFDEL